MVNPFTELSTRLAGLERLKGEGAVLSIGYEATASRDGEVIALAYRGTRFAVLTESSLTVWHNHTWVSKTLQRRINSTLRPYGRVMVIRDGKAYIADSEAGGLVPFPANEPFIITPREGHTK